MKHHALALATSGGVGQAGLEVRVLGARGRWGCRQSGGQSCGACDVGSASSNAVSFAVTGGLCLCLRHRTAANVGCGFHRLTTRTITFWSRHKEGGNNKARCVCARNTLRVMLAGISAMASDCSGENNASSPHNACRAASTRTASMVADMEVRSCATAWVSTPLWTVAWDASRSAGVAPLQTCSKLAVHHSRLAPNPLPA